jgi:hypothetical protein
MYCDSGVPLGEAQGYNWVSRGLLLASEAETPLRSVDIRVELPDSSQLCRREAKT